MFNLLWQDFALLECLKKYEHRKIVSFTGAALELHHVAFSLATKYCPLVNAIRLEQGKVCDI